MSRSPSDPVSLPVLPQAAPVTPDKAAVVGGEVPDARRMGGRGLTGLGLPNLGGFHRPADGGLS